MIPLFRVAMSPQATSGVAGVLASGRLEHGPRVDDFEVAVGRRLGNDRVVAVNCGTSGLHLALHLALRGRTPGEVPAAMPGAMPGEVLCTPLTFEGTNWPVLAHGLPIRWVDVDPATLTMDLDDLDRKISRTTRAIIVVHWTGYPVDLNRLRHVLSTAADRLGIEPPPVIEDAAQAWGATYRGVPLGAHGNMCVFSLGAIKLLTTGSGGLLVLPTDELDRQARLGRWFGIDRTADRVHGDYDVTEYGFRFYMNDIAAAIGLANLDIVDELLARQRDNAAFYDKELASVPGVEHTERADDREPSFWMYPLKVDDRAGFMRKLTGAGIMTSLISRRNDAHSVVADYHTELPGLNSIADRVVNIPVGWSLSDDDRGHIVDTIRAGW